jgi:sterol desaturase/sphingolipid hydroxylase (fatty acid hydroxylase superfamily)
MARRIAIELTVVLTTLCACIVLEAIRPVQRRLARTVAFNLLYAGFIVTWSVVLQPVADSASRWVHVWIRMPQIPLPERGWPVVFSAMVLMAVQDLQFYWVHRAQHSSALLWAMHSFHHSDDDVNVATAYRHYWLEKPAWLAITYLPLGIAFRVSLETGAVYAGIYLFFALFPHMNSRIELGKLSSVFLGPQVHRIHHSADPADYNTNFAGAFPVWDLIFGTYRAPRRGEFPASGVPSMSSTPGPMDAIIWPICRPISRGGPTAEPTVPA